MSIELVRKNINRFGWHFLFVFDDKQQKESYAYTIGFEETFNHPEILIVGLTQHTAYSIISTFSHELRKGKNYPFEKKLPGFLSGGFDIMLTRITESAVDRYMGLARHFYQQPFRAVVLLWPDQHNRLPTETGCQLPAKKELQSLVYYQ